MLLKVKISILVLFTTVLSLSSETAYKWKEIPAMPALKGERIQAGVAGAFHGMLTIKQEDGASYEVAVVAGGANFSEKPLVDGGKKLFHDDIYILETTDGKYSWKLTDYKIDKKFAVAYGASCRLSDSEILLIGGQTADGKPSDAINLLTLNKDLSISIAPAKIKIDDKTYHLPKLPVTAVNSSAIKIKDTIWVIAGKQSIPEGKEGANRVWTLNTKAKDLAWKEELSLPGPLRSQQITVAQKGGFQDRALFYVISGIGNKNGNVTALTDGYAYLRKDGNLAAEWRSIAPVKPFGEDKDISLLGGKGMASGVHNILFFGGYNKDVFNSWLVKYNSAKGTDSFEQVKKDFFGKTPAEFNWNRKVLSYNTVTNTWTTIGEMPEGTLPNCGASIFKKGNDFIITGGEIKPGVRTATGFIFSIDDNPSFGLLNWSVLVFYLIGMLMLGVYFMRRENGAEDFMKGGGRIPWWAAGVSIFATMLSSLSFMAIPAMTYVKDWRVFTAAITIALCVPVVTKIYLPFFRRLNVTSAYEYLEVRFNTAVRSIASIVFIMYMVARIGIVLYLPSVALNAVTGIDIMTCIIVIGLITIVYCTMGGIEAVVWGDFVQGIVLIAGAILALVWLTVGTEGGFSGFTNIAESADKLKTFDFAFDIKQPCFWVILVGGFFGNVIQYTSDQSVVQRYLTTKDEAGARKSLWLNGLLSVPVSIVFYGIGSALYTYYKTHPMELNVVMTQADQIFPHFMMTKLPAGIAGLLIAAVFSATMSTLSSNINSAATAFTTDFYKRFFNPSADDHRSLKICRYATVFVGLGGMGLAWIVNLMQSQEIFNFFNMMVGLMLSGLGAFFAMGILTKFVTGRGALLGFACNIGILYQIKQMNIVNGWLYSFIGLAVTFALSILFSLILGGRKDIKGLTIYDLKDMKEK